MITLKAILVVLATVVNKALIPLFKVKGLTISQIYTKATTVTNAIETNVLTFGVMDPTTAEMLDDIVAGQLLVTQIQDKEVELKTMREELTENLDKVKSNMIYNYCTSVKNSAGGVKSIVQLTGLELKGMGPAKTLIRFNNTYPEPYKVNQSIGLRIILDLMASDALSKGKPYGAKSIICYRQVGGIAPLRNNHPLAVAMPPFGKMKLTDTNFITANIGQIVYYIFCWVDKDGNIGPESAVYFYTVTA
jgi:hypothetical protein